MSVQDRNAVAVVSDGNICQVRTTLFGNREGLQSLVCDDAGILSDSPTFFFKAGRDEPLRSLRETMAALIMST